MKALDTRMGDLVNMEHKAELVQDVKLLNGSKPMEGLKVFDKLVAGLASCGVDQIDGVDLASARR